MDDVKDLYKNGINKSQDEINNNNNELNNLTNSYNQNYDSQLENYNKLIQQQQDYIDKETQTLNSNQQKQTDYDIGIINQNKDQAAKDTDKELKSSYGDYMKQNNQYGGASETLASQGLATQGFAESSKIGMYSTWQNRVSTAKEALTKANVDFSNQINAALLKNDAAQAENSLNQLKQSYQLALSGFEFKENLYNAKNTYLQDLNNSYYSRNQDLESRIASYNSELTNLDKWEQEQAAAREQEKYNRNFEREKFNEQIRQYNNDLAEKKREYDKDYEANYSSFTDKNTTDTTVESTYSPSSLSGDSAYKFLINLTPKMSQNDLESKLTSAYNKGLLNDDDVNKILKSYGIS